jgi:hypothetical protein
MIGIPRNSDSEGGANSRHHSIYQGRAISPPFFFEFSNQEGWNDGLKSDTEKSIQIDFIQGGL